MNSPVKILTKRVEGCYWIVTKSVTKQKAKLNKFIFESFVVSRTQETSM